MTLRTRLHKLCATRFEMSTSDWVERIMKEFEKEIDSVKRKHPASTKNYSFNDGWLVGLEVLRQKLELEAS